MVSPTELDVVWAETRDKWVNGEGEGRGWIICSVRRVSSGETMIPVKIWAVRGTRSGKVLDEKIG